MKKTIPYSLITALLFTNTLIADEQLEDITITSATQSAQSIHDVTSDVDVITAEMLEEQHYTTITEALNSLSGINFTANGGIGSTSSLYLRGFANQKVLVVIDGIRYNDPTNSSGAMLENLPITDIQQIEVLKGSQSGIWGADAAAGVILITTKKAQQGVHFHASESFGSFDTLQTNTGISYANGHFYLKANHTLTSTEGFTAQAPIDEHINQFENDGYRNQTTHLQAGVAINPTNHIDLSHTIIDTQNDYDLEIYDANYQLDRVASANNNATGSTKTTLSSINYNHVDSFNEVDFYAKRSTFEREYLQEWTPYYKGELQEYGMKSKIPYLGHHFVLWGGDYKRYDQEKSFDKQYTNKALFVTNNNQFATFENDTTIITESLRHDRYSNFDNKTTGKVGLKHTFGNLNDLSLAANYGTAYNVPAAFQLYATGYGNPSLQPENIQGYDLTIAYQGLEVTYFDNVIEDMIDYDFVTSRYETVEGKSKLKGYEANYNHAIGDILMLSLGYTRLDAKDRDSNKLLRRPDSSVKLALDYYGIDRLHLGVNGQYIGQRQDMDFSTRSNVDTGKYIVANFVANYKVDKYLTLFGKIENITDKYYQTIYGYTSSPRAVYGGIKLSY